VELGRARIPQRLEPGDLVFFFSNISHVGMYIGNGMMINAHQLRRDVKVEPVFWSSFVGASGSPELSLSLS